MSRERREQGEERKKREREQWRRALQQPATSRRWGVRISCIWSNAPAMLSKWVLSPPQAPPRIGTRATAHTMPCCQDWEEEAVQHAVGLASLSVAGGRQPWGKNRQLFGSWWYMCLTMQWWYMHLGTDEWFFLDSILWKWNDWEVDMMIYQKWDNKTLLLFWSWFSVFIHIWINPVFGPNITKGVTNSDEPTEIIARLCSSPQLYEKFSVF